MVEFPSEPIKLTPGRRAAAFLGLIAVVLLQVSLATHQFQHAADHGFSVCQVCTSHNQLEDAAAFGDLAVDVSISPHRAVETTAQFFIPAPSAAPYRSRAPPVS